MKFLNIIKKKNKIIYLVILINYLKILTFYQKLYFIIRFLSKSYNYQACLMSYRLLKIFIN